MTRCSSGWGSGRTRSWASPARRARASHGATHLIERIKVEPGLTLQGVKRAMVVGGGNTALDIAHELALLGVEVDMVYRRSEKEMGGYTHELDGARLDGVRLLENRQPVESRPQGRQAGGGEAGGHPRRQAGAGHRGAGAHGHGGAWPLARSAPRAWLAPSRAWSWTRAAG